MSWPLTTRVDFQVKLLLVLPRLPMHCDRMSSLICILSRVCDVVAWLLFGLQNLNKIRSNDH